MEKKKQRFRARITKKERLGKNLIRLGNQVLLSAVLLLGVLIAVKSNQKAKEFIYRNVYQKNLKFAEISTWYNQHFGKLLPIKNTTETVFKEDLIYQSANLYKDGVELKVANQYMVPVLESGIVVFIGEKEGYGNTIIVQQVNGIDVWYGNVSTLEISLYDYVEKGTLLGESKEDKLYLVFQKDGKFVDYKEYLT